MLSKNKNNVNFEDVIPRISQHLTIEERIVRNGPDKMNFRVYAKCFAQLVVQKNACRLHFFGSFGVEYRLPERCLIELSRRWPQKVCEEQRVGGKRREGKRQNASWRGCVSAVRVCCARNMTSYIAFPFFPKWASARQKFTKLRLQKGNHTNKVQKL